MSDLEVAFHKEMTNIFHKTVQATNYRPTQFFRMVNEIGGLATAHQLLAGDQVSDGFTKLWERGRLDLSVEAVALKPEYASLFSAEELDRARKRLADVNYTPPWLTSGASLADPSPPAASPSLVERLSRAVQNTDPGAAAPTAGVTGAVAGLRDEDQIRIALQTMVAHGGEATVQQIYDAVEAEMGGQHLSEQGKASLRTFINRDAVENGYVHPAAPGQQSWRITPESSAAMSRRTSSWIFQSNPEYFDLPGALAALAEMDWEVRQYANEIHADDTVYLWESGTNSGILAVARVLTEPAEMAEDEDEQRFNRDSTRFAGTKRRVRLRVTYVLPERIRRDELQDHPILKDMLIIRSPQRTNFPLTEEQAAALAELIDRLQEPDQEDDELEATDETEVVDSLQEWQSKIQPSQQIAHLFAYDYPDWLRTTFSGRVVFNALARQAFSVFVDGRRRMRGYARQTDGVYVWLSEPDPVDVAFLRDELSRPETVRPRTRHGVPGYRFSVDTPEDYGTLQAFTRRLVESTVQPPDEIDVGDPAVQRVQPATSLAEWQGRTHSTHPIVHRAITELPAWLQETFGNRIELRIYNKPELGVFVHGYWRIYFAFNPQRSLYVLFANPDEAILERLRTELSNASSIKPRDYGASGGYRFFVNTEADYALLKQLILKLLADIAPPLPGSAPWPAPDGARQAFVLFFGAEHEHQEYGKTYSFSNKAVGEPRKLANALQAMQQGGLPVDVIIYRPGPHYAFTAWARITETKPEERSNETVWKLKLDQHEFPVPLYLKGNAAHLSAQIAWLAKGLPSAFAFHSIRKVETADFNRIIDAARAAAGDTSTMSLADAAFTVLVRAGGGPLNLASILEQGRQQAIIRDGVSHMELSSTLLGDARFANLSGDMWLLAEPPIDPTFVPQIYAGPDAQFWRIHFPRELWDEARRNNVIGVDWPLDATTNQSVQRLKRINVGDRIVAYVQGGTFGGIGVVTHRYTDIRVTSDPAFPSGVFGGKYPQRIGVAWADVPAAPVDVLTQLREPDNTQLYNRVRNPHTIIPLSRDDYINILTMLEAHDAGTPIVEDQSRLPSAWSSLDQFRDFAQSLDDRAYTTIELHGEALMWGPGFVASLDPEAFADELRQLRVLHLDGDDSYRLQPYVAGDPFALLRLMALALLLPIEGTEAAYQLPARAIVPRLRTATEPQPDLQTFAPELGADGLRLLEWYAEAALVEPDGDSWQASVDALALFSDDDAASTEYNRYLATLLAEIDGTLAEGLPPIDGRPLEPVRDLSRRLNELGQDLLIEHALVLRVYRSLLAGRHVVLSGPPGTGKTELAKRLPTILWREDPRTVQRLATDLDQPPVVAIPLARHGYKPIVVTATEDWGVRDVVGGIAPRLNDQTNGLSYDIQHGHLTRVILQHFDGTNDGQTLPQDVQRLQRREYQAADEKDKRYRGAWLVIDEFTRAPVDAAFGSLLTTLGSGDGAVLNVPAGDFSEVPLPLPRDFRIIGTLNSFDRHFLNQMSEAMKRRFDFIDVPPPGPHLAAYEQGSAVLKALRALRHNGFTEIVEGSEPQLVHWPGVIEITVVPDTDGVTRYRLGSVAPDAEAALQSFWHIFSAIRVFRQLGTAQAIAVYTNVFTGVLVGMSWPEALDTALADSLADQLQVLTRDEQRMLEAYLEYAQDAARFAPEVVGILAQVPQGRRPSLLYALRETEQLRGDTSTITTRAEHVLTIDELRRVFNLDQSIALPSPSIFRRRLHDLINERGL